MLSVFGNRPKIMTSYKVLKKAKETKSFNLQGFCEEEKLNYYEINSFVNVCDMIVRNEIDIPKSVNRALNTNKTLSDNIKGALDSPDDGSEVQPS
ncbi:MAG: hypothetical protein AB9856_03655 [Cellulosilyticaceae bacterium]